MRTLRSGDRDLVVVLAGTVLQAFDLDGRRRWWLPATAISRLVDTGDLDGTGAGGVLARADARTLLLLDAGTGSVRWRWQAPPGTFINDHAGVLLVPVRGGHRLVICATYATTIVAFDLVGEGSPIERWEVPGPWDAGFGPSIVAADMDGDSHLELVLSSRMGSADRTAGGTVSAAKRVLGRRHGLLYQAIHDLGDGRAREETTYAPDARAYRCARPYGLLTARPLAPHEPPSIVLASSQVEEYLAVTHRRKDGSLGRRWGRFIEKDWPRDDRELRVHVDALVDLRDDGCPELIASLWERGRWTTRIIDPRVGWDAARLEVEGRVCWGVVRSPAGRAALVLSREDERATGRATDLELVDGRDLTVLDRLRDASVMVAEDASLALDTAFMARRTGGTHLSSPDGGDALAVRRWKGGRVREVALWNAGSSSRGLTRVATGDAVRVDAAGDELLVGRPDGSLEIRSRSGGRARGRMDTHGRAAHPIVRLTRGGPELLVDHAAGRVVGYVSARGRSMRARWSIPGRLPSATATADEPLVFVQSGTGPWAVEAWPDPGSAAGPLWRIPLDAPLDHPVLPLPGGRVALTIRTGVHTLATELRDRDGRLIARVPLGAYLHPPALIDQSDDPLLVLDDHGILVVLDLEGRERWRRDWTAAYSMPITGPFLRGGAPGIIRSNGIHGVSLLDRNGRQRWRRDAELWLYAAGRGAILLTEDGPILAMPRRDGLLEARVVRTGAPRWILTLGPGIEHAAITTGDVDGDGHDELLVGMPDGRLWCIADEASEPRLRWSIDLGAGVNDAWLADVAGDGHAVIVASLSDGTVRVLA